MIHKNNQDSCAAKIVISSPDLSETARFIRNLSDLKQIFLHMGSVEEEYYEPGVDDIKGIKVKETLNYLKKEDKRSRKNHNPDEIIDGKPKWSEMKFVRKRRRSNGEDIEHEDSFDFDRLNPHRTFVQEFEDQLDNTDWVYNNTVLKMMSDLNSETLVTLGDARLPPEAGANIFQ